jgi:hypothetical protein
MGHYYNPVITSFDTLALNIDAANVRSYPGTGNTCYDLSLRNNRGTLSSVTFAGSGGTGAFVFDGATSSINLGTVSGGNQTTSWTLESWIKPNSAGEGNSGRIYQHSSGSLTGYICALDNSAVSNGIKLNTYAVGGFTVRIGNCITNGVWQQVVWAFSPGLVTYYVNGTAIGSSSTTSPASYTGTDYIGNDPGGTSTFDGSIGIVRLYGNTLTAAQIRKNYDSIKTRYGL